MLMQAIDEYLAVRRAVGFRLRVTEYLLRSFAQLAVERGEDHVCQRTAIDWAALALSPEQRDRRLKVVRIFARHARAENAAHEIPPDHVFAHSRTRRRPYIFTCGDVVKKMFEMYTVDKMGTQAITRALNDSGSRKRSGKKWDKRVILHMLKNPVYMGKPRWREVLYDGNHDPIIPEIIFDEARRILKKRSEDLNGRRWHNGDQRLLSGLIKCSRCRSHMVGTSSTKGERSIPYYVCTKRLNTHDCKQDYVRGDLLDAALVEDVKSMFRDEKFMARIWEEASAPASSASSTARAP